MSKRQTHACGFDLPINLFNSFEEALKAADAIGRHINRYCTRKGYACVAFIGISEGSGKLGEIHISNMGKKKYVSNIGQLGIRPPHIHICILANPASTIFKEIESYVRRKYATPSMLHEMKMKGQKLLCWIKSWGKDFNTRIEYVVRQSVKFRTTFAGDLTLLNEYLYDFCEIFERENEKHIGRGKAFAALYRQINSLAVLLDFSSQENNSEKTITEDKNLPVIENRECAESAKMLFTNSKAAQMPKALDSIGFSQYQKIPPKLPCNNNINNNINKNTRRSINNSTGYSKRNINNVKANSTGKYMRDDYKFNTGIYRDSKGVQRSNGKKDNLNKQIFVKTMPASLVIGIYRACVGLSSCRDNLLTPNVRPP